VADRTSQLVLTALSRASAEAGLPLHGNKSNPGLFPSTALGKQAAQRCCEEGYLRPVPGAAANGRKSTPMCALTDKGRAFLLSQLSPRQVLEDLVRAVEAREAQVGQLQAQVRQLQTGLEAVRASVAPVLDQVRQGETSRNLNGLAREFRQDESAPVDPATAIVAALERWAQSGAPEDCPLSELFRQVRTCCPQMSLGIFHDALRKLQDIGRIYLHPWTGPLYEIPEPPCSLLVGHEIAYYASVRTNAE
jgi:hypothetical protein